MLSGNFVYQDQQGVGSDDKRVYSFFYDFEFKFCSKGMKIRKVNYLKV